MTNIKTVTEKARKMMIFREQSLLDKLKKRL